MIICDFCKTGEEVKPVQFQITWLKNASQFAKIIKRDMCQNCMESMAADIERILKYEFRGINESL